MEQTKKIANPAPLGLLGFGMTTILLNLHNAGITQLSAVIAAMGFALGGLAQLIAGILEFKKGNTFGGTAFTAYGVFWWSLVLIWRNPFGANVLGGDKLSMGFYLLIWCLFTAVMFICTFKHNIITRVVFGSLTLLFLMLSIGDFVLSGGASSGEVILNIAGYIGIACGLSAMYSALGQIVNEEFGKKICPLI